MRLADPFAMNDVVSYDYFCRWFLALNPGVSIDESMRVRYSDYLTDLEARTARPFVANQVNRAWFRDCYDETEQDNQSKVKAYENFMTALSGGKYTEFDVERTSDPKTGYGMLEKVYPNSIARETTRSEHVLSMSSISPETSRTTIESHIRNNLGEYYSLSIARPENEQSSRVGWLTLHDDTNIDEALAKLTNVGLAGIQFSLYYPPSADCKKRILWSVLNEDTALEHHIAQLEDLTTRLDTAASRESFWHQLITAAGPTLVRQVDLAVEYLRQAHYLDYWTLRQYDSVMSLLETDPGYARFATSSSSELPAYEIWAADHARRIKMVLDPSSYLSNIRQVSVEQQVSEAVSSRIKQEDETRYRCQVLDCTKLFKDVPFVQKHIEKRHGEWLAQVTKEAELLVKFLVDPNKVSPYREYQEPKSRRSMSPPHSRQRRRSPPGHRNGYGGSGGYRGGGGRGDYRGPSQNYRDLDKPAEELPELDY